jgi:hypothetical protein
VHPPEISTVFDEFLSERDIYRNYIDGVGKCPKNDMRVMYYPSRLTVPYAKETMILHDVLANTYALEIDIYEGNDQSRARNAASYVQSLIADAVPGLNFERENGPPGFAYWNIVDQERRPFGRVMLRENPAGGSFGAVLTVYSTTR